MVREETLSLSQKLLPWHIQRKQSLNRRDYSIKRNLLQKACKLNQEEDHLTDQKMVTSKSTSDLKAEVIDLSPEADQIRLRKEHVFHVAKKVTGNPTVQTEDTRMVVTKQ